MKMKGAAKLPIMEWITSGKDPHKGKWVVSFGSSLVMLGSGVALAWSCIAFHLFLPIGNSPKDVPISCYSSSVWPMLLYAIGMYAALPAGSLLDNKLGPRTPCIGGACISFAACMGGSFAVSSLWIILITFGVLNGAGFGLLLSPAGTAALRWDPRSGNTISIMRGIAFMAGFLFFAPMSIAMMDRPPAILERLARMEAGSSGTAQYLDSHARLEVAIRVMAGLAFFFQILGAVFIENPHWYSAKEVRASAQQRKAGGDVDEPLLPRKVAVLPPLQGADLRLVYIAHLLTPFSLAPVWDTALKVQALFLSPPQHSSWEPTAVGVSLRVRQALRTPRAWILLVVGTLNACACGMLLTLWRMTVPSGSAVHIEVTTAFAGLFGMMTPAFWGAFTATSSSFSAVVLNQTIGSIACACAAASSGGGPGFSAVALAMSLAFFVGSTAIFPRFIAIAFGPHRLVFLLFGHASVCTCFGLALAAGTVEASVRIRHGMEYAFAGASSLLGFSALVFLIAPCYRRRLGRILDLPSAYHLKFEDEEGADDESDVSSDLDFQEAEGDLPTKPLNLGAAVREYQKQQKARKELDGPLLAPSGSFIEDESIIHFPAGPLEGAPDDTGEPLSNEGEILSGSEEAELNSPESEESTRPPVVGGELS